jgi:hypothetical protein
MTASTDPSTPTVHVTVSFPLIDKTIQASLNSALPKLSSTAILTLAACSHEVDDYETVSKVLKLLAADIENEELRTALKDYNTEYARLSRKLREHRGYGLDGGEEPTLKLEFTELLAWLALHKPDTHNEVLLDYVGPDLHLTKTGTRWHWATHNEPRYVLSKEQGSKHGEKGFASVRKAAADAVAKLALLDVVTRHYQANR